MLRLSWAVTIKSLGSLRLCLQVEQPGYPSYSPYLGLCHLDEYTPAPAPPPPQVDDVIYEHPLTVARSIFGLILSIVCVRHSCLLLLLHQIDCWAEYIFVLLCN